MINLDEWRAAAHPGRNFVAAEVHILLSEIERLRKSRYAEGEQAALVDVLAMLEMRATVVNDPITLMAAAKWVRQRLAEIEATGT